MRVLAAAMALGAVAACTTGRPAAPVPSRPALRIEERVPGGGVTRVSVVGLPAADLARLRTQPPTAGTWSALLRVTGEPPQADLPPVAGTHRVTAAALQFEPAFPLDPGVAHRVVFDPSRLPAHGVDVGTPPSAVWRTEALTLSIPAARVPSASVTRVSQVFPEEALLENQLRVYIHFSGPMGTRGAPEHVRLLGEDGQPVEGAFLPLDVGLWDAPRRRYTLLFDPGRVKRGILPHMALGRPLKAGRRYTLEVDRAWRDAEGRPLAETFRRTFRVVPAVMAPIVPGDWRLEVPAVGTREPLRVAFPRPLDQALAERAFSVRDRRGGAVAGGATVEQGATRWTFTPDAPWVAGRHELRALPELEDPAGNRVGRPFDFDPGQPVPGGGDGRDTHAEARVFFVPR